MQGTQSSKPTALGRRQNQHTQVGSLVFNGVKATRQAVRRRWRGAEISTGMRVAGGKSGWWYLWRQEASPPDDKSPQGQNRVSDLTPTQQAWAQGVCYRRNWHCTASWWPCWLAWLPPKGVAPTQSKWAHGSRFQPVLLWTLVSLQVLARDTHCLLQSLHQGFVGLDADLDLGPRSLVRCP